MKKRKQGISLIVLVITIIVMIILAATIIISLTNNGIVDKAKDAVRETNETQLKQMIALAWSEARLKDTTETKDDAYYYKEVMNSLKASGVTDKDLEGYEIIATTQGATLTSELNEYGFYYDKLYLAENATTSDSFGYVLHKDGSAEYYEEIDGILFCINALPSGSAVYAKNQITLGTLTGTVSNKGMSLTANNITATIQTLENQEVQYGYEYEVEIDGTTWLVVVDKTNTLTLYEVISEDEKNETATSVQISGEGHYITNTAEEVIAYVSYDGKNILTKVEDEDKIFMLTERKVIVHKGIIPEGAAYYVGVEGSSGDYTTATATYTAGDPFPETMNTGDIYVYGDYEYRYNMGFIMFLWAEYENTTGWGVMVRSTGREKTELKPALAEINNEPITMMLFTYTNCKNMIVAPKIPDTVAIMQQTFAGCTALTTAPILPSSLQNMRETFQNCSSLNTYTGSTEQVGSFLNYVIPSGVTSMYATFTKCTSMKTTPDMSKATAVKDMWAIFSDCTALVTATAIPSGVEDLGYAFSGCTALVTAPSLSKTTKLTDLNATFEGCTKLTGAPTIPSTVVNMDSTFEGCTALVTAPTIPSSVKDLGWTFSGCTNLTGTVTINATPDDYMGTFSGTVKSIRIAGSCPSSIKKEMAYDGTNITY